MLEGVIQVSFDRSQTPIGAVSADAAVAASQTMMGMTTSAFFGPAPIRTRYARTFVLDIPVLRPPKRDPTQPSIRRNFAEKVRCRK